MIDIEYGKYSRTSIDDFKDEEIKAHLKTIPTFTDEIKDKKINEFEESAQKSSSNKNYKLTNLVLKRHFLIKAIQ